MNAIILAAGVSRRLYPITHSTPKCLLELNGKAILAYQLDALIANGITDITLVVGYRREQLIQYLQQNYPQIEFNLVINQHFFETNTAYSVNLCQQILNTGPGLLMNGDVLYPAQLIQRIIASEYENVMAVEVKSCGAEEVKVIEGANQRLTTIGKKLMPENCLGEFIGVARFSAEFNSGFAGSLERLITAGGLEDYFEAAINPLLVKHLVFYEDISDLPCIEIDFAEDYQQAQNLIKSKIFHE